MALFSEEDGVQRIPATSPSRRDYQLRSFSSEKLSEYETSRPQSPWLPRAAVSLDRRDSRLFCSGEASPMPSYFSGAVLPGFMTERRRQEEGSECSSSREEEGDIDEVGEVLYSSYLKRKEEARSSRMRSPSPVNSADSVTRRGRMRNCVSGDLGMRFELAQQRAQTARGCRSGDLAGLEIPSDGILLSPDMRSEVAALVKVGREISMRRQMSSRENERRSSEALAIVAVDERRSSEALAMVAVDVQRSNSETAMVEIPFKWEELPVEASSNNAFLRSSSVSRPEAQIMKEMSFGSSHRFYGGALKGSGSESESDVKRVSPAPVKLEKSSSVSSSVASSKLKRVVSSAVPFKWEVEPGKPKAEEKASYSPEAAPSLQLPPRLASSSRRSSSSASAPSSRRNSTVVALSGYRARQSLSASVSSSMQQPSLDKRSPSPCTSQDAKPRRTLATAFHSDSITAGQSDCTPPKRAPVSSQFGSPQYQSADYLCEDSVSWNRVHSPTSTLCGPGSDNHSTPSSCKSDKSSRNSSVSFSHSQSGTSAESFEQWSYGDHISPSSRHPSIRESEGFSRANSVSGHEDGDHAYGKITKLRRKLNLSSKPPKSSTRAASAAFSSRSVDVNDYSSHGEEYFDCQEEAEAERPTRLPYKMPSPVHDIEPQAASTSSSPTTRGSSDFSSCLGLPKFLSKGATPGLQWVENPSWDLPSNTVEDGYKSPAYKATLELLSPSPSLMSKKTGSRPVSKLPRSSSARRRHPHLVEVLCNSLRQSLQRCTKRSVARTQSVLGEDQFTKRHQSFVW